LHMHFVCYRLPPTGGDFHLAYHYTCL
jgi:hypothetical protein